jgi:dTDP-glucose 4,6-dehydratase
MATLLVTGAAGFIGSTFVRQRLEQGDQIVVLDALTYAGHRENLEGLELDFVTGNICDSFLVSGILNRYSVDAVVNFAAESHVDRSIDHPSAFIETNIQGVFTLLQASLEYWNTEGRKKDFKFLQVSTDEVYGSLGSTGFFTEESPYLPNSPYSASKASGDMLVRAWHHTYRLPTIITNCSNNYGPRQFPEKLIPYMITCALSDKYLPLYGDGGNIRDWIHVEDHCRGISLALEKGRPGATYCFGGRSERNNREVVKTICQELDQMHPRSDGKPHESAIKFVTDRLGHDHRYAIDDSLAERELGFKRKYSNFEAGLKDTVQWYLENEAWCQAVTMRRSK